MTERHDLAAMIARIAARGWCPATAGNYSVRLPGDHLRMLISPSGVDKTGITAADLLDVTVANGQLVGDGKPSAEYLLHVAVYEVLGANAVLHVHTIWNTLLSTERLAEGTVEIGGYEILKALDGVMTHEHTEIVPVMANSQDMPALSQKLRGVLQRYPKCHGFLLAGHGLYTWGDSLPSAYRHLEALEFLFEVVARESYRTGR